MKLLSAHIENFGALKNTDYTFSKGLNCICKENGAGKTTFAAFLCAMLYGYRQRKRPAIEGTGALCALECRKIRRLLRIGDKRKHLPHRAGL